MSSLVSSLIGVAGGSPLLIACAIILGVFFLEDTTVVVVGMLAADGIFSVPFALASLYAGIIFGDIGLYCLGRFASTHPWFAQYIDNKLVATFRAWLETRFVLTVFTARFIPGARMPTYTASGFFHSSFSTFIATTTIATSVWTTFLFSASYWFGSLSSAWTGPVRWSIALIFLIALFFIGRHNLLAYQAQKEELD